MKGFITVAMCSLVVLAFSQGANAEAKSENHVSGSGDKQFGQHVPGDVLIQEDKVEESFGPWTVTTQYTYQDGSHRITYIEMIDKSGTQTGAAAYDIYGGVGTNYVRIDFRSMPLRGIWYVVKIYGERI